MGELVSVVSTKPVRDFVGPVVGVHFMNDGVIYYDVRANKDTVIRHIDQLDVHGIDHHRAPARATRNQKEKAA